MSKGKYQPKYDSSRSRDDYTSHPGRLFSLDYFPETGECSLYLLDDRQAEMLRKMLAVFPKYHWVWGLPSPRKDWDASTEQLWDDISTLVAETEACLVSGCEVSELIEAIGNISVNADLVELTKAVKELTAVMASQQRDLTLLVPDNVDYSADGVSKPLKDAATYIGPHPAP